MIVWRCRGCSLQLMWEVRVGRRYKHGDGAADDDDYQCRHPSFLPHFFPSLIPSLRPSVCLSVPPVLSSPSVQSSPSLCRRVGFTLYYQRSFHSFILSHDGIYFFLYIDLYFLLGFFGIFLKVCILFACLLSFVLQFVFSSVLLVHFFFFFTHFKFCSSWLHFMFSPICVFLCLFSSISSLFF